MKTFVLVAGLISMVPQVDSQGKIVSVTLLVFNAKGSLGGESVHPHEPLLEVFTRGPELSRKPRNATLQAGAGATTFNDPSGRILNLSGLLSKAPTLRPECLVGDVQKDCLREDNKTPALFGRVTLKGTWVARPVDIDVFDNPRPDDIDKTVLGFLSLQPPHVSPLETRSAGAVLFETDQLVKLDVNGEVVSIPTLPKETCEAFNVAHRDCSFIKVTNLPKSGDVPPKCGDRQGLVDTHFALIYDLFLTKPEFRYVPFNRQEDVDYCKSFLQRPGEGGDPPRVKCPPNLFPSVSRRR